MIRAAHVWSTRWIAVGCLLALTTSSGPVSSFTFGPSSMRPIAAHGLNALFKGDGDSRACNRFYSIVILIDDAHGRRQ
jgi:hypothetical protein